MAQQTIEISCDVKSELEAKQVKTAMENISKIFKPAELALIAKKLENPLVKMKIRSFL